ncbi:hypothetical protein CM49_04549 [Paenibacillus sp. P1XP2]|nr:hypothetical protein CM49_04549 [Paenibacillus sp. P1XP2]
MKMEVPWDKIKSSRVVAEFVPDPDTNEAEFAVEEFRTVWEPRAAWEPFDEAVQSAKEDFASWLDRSLPVSELSPREGNLRPILPGPASSRRKAC